MPGAPTWSPPDLLLRLQRLCVEQGRLHDEEALREGAVAAAAKAAPHRAAIAAIKADLAANVARRKGRRFNAAGKAIKADLDAALAKATAAAEPVLRAAEWAAQPVLHIDGLAKAQVDLNAAISDLVDAIATSPAVQAVASADSARAVHAAALGNGSRRTVRAAAHRLKVLNAAARKLAFEGLEVDPPTRLALALDAIRDATTRMRAFTLALALPCWGTKADARVHPGMYLVMRNVLSLFLTDYVARTVRRAHAAPPAPCTPARA